MKAEEPPAATDADLWRVYVLVSDDGTRTYVGISTDPERRLLEHNGDYPGGAKSTRYGRPWMIGRLLGPYEDRSTAQRAEYRLKQKRGRERLHAHV